jgi:hypothetical protein
MRSAYVVHIVGGSLALVAGFMALYAGKGATVHRRAGTVFVYAMLASCVAGFTMAVVRGVAPAVNVPAALLTGYMVVTAVTTLRPRAPRRRWQDVAAMLTALAVAAASLAFAVEAFANGGTRKGMPAFPFVLFGVVGVIAVVGDVRMLRSGPLQGARRIARHLWRMSFALFVAALSFFIGQAQVFPKPIRIPALLALPVLAILVTMFYWLWRVRLRRSLRGLIVVHAAGAA